MQRKLFREDHEQFRQSFRQFLEREVKPHQERWNEAGIVDREVWRKAGEAGFLCPWMEPEYGGAGGDFLHSVVVMEELARIYESGFAMPLHSDVVVPYIHEFGDDAQKKRWLPGCVSGEAGDGGRDDGAGHGLGPGGHQHHGGARRRLLRHQRRQDVHLQRHPLRPVRRGGEDGPGPEERAPGHLALRGRGGHARASSRARS